MIKIYQSTLEDSSLQVIDAITPGTWINVTDPTIEEVEELSLKVQIDTEFLNYILDEDEIPRTDTGKDKHLVVIDVPTKKRIRNHTLVTTTPLTIMTVRDEYILTFSKGTNILEQLVEEKKLEIDTRKRSRFIIEVLYKVATEYLQYLKRVNEEIEKCEDLLFQSTRNKDLEKLVTLEKSLVYIMTSLHRNKAVLDKILKNTAIEFYEEDRALLEDAIIENEQALEIAHLYREILSSTTDSFATIISNNLNGVMKFLAGITIVISIPTMVASFFGMNVPLGELSKNPYSFFLLLLLSLILSGIVAIILRKKNML